MAFYPNYDKGRVSRWGAYLAYLDSTMNLIRFGTKQSFKDVIAAHKCMEVWIVLAE